ncbi:hypothetical protein JHK82_012309 [Glycine max]|uniref:Uncharacterized protein n=2 Tax=Glycine subgen. Soja TaxID=1462606 RepID=A0A0R0JSX2_SOYBN|nr:hypothetical protein JHK87_012214 [Glycine soja]KAG5040187.1 hypothetical protein JHK85_012663 [Glycine max]KAG5057326.1 hypothetical protein JHK86_012322 [Glycine max]KAG5154340.1 hypothetical protein JHK82_012309 [Glycine max]RZC11650.1 hypothetical protein D0Y65_011729 [Glycine soja]
MNLVDTKLYDSTSIFLIRQYDLCYDLSFMDVDKILPSSNTLGWHSPKVNVEVQMKKDLWWIPGHPETRKGVVSNEMLQGVENKGKRQLGELKHLNSQRKRKQKQFLECCTLDGKSLVTKSITSLCFDPSSMGHVESHLTGHLGIKHYFGAGHESGTKSRQTLNTRCVLKITWIRGCIDNQEVCLEATTLERVRNSSLIERSCTEDEQG